MGPAAGEERFVIGPTATTGDDRVVPDHADPTSTVPPLQPQAWGLTLEAIDDGDGVLVALRFEDATNPIPAISSTVRVAPHAVPTGAMHQALAEVLTLVEARAVRACTPPNVPSGRALCYHALLDLVHRGLRSLREEAVARRTARTDAATPDPP